MVKALINNIEGIFYYDKRIPQDNHPQDYPYMYHIRHDEDDWTIPISIERVVYVNFFGTVFFKRPLDIQDMDYIDIKSFFIDYNAKKFYVSDTVFKYMFKL